MRLRNRLSAVLALVLALLQAVPGLALAQDAPPPPTPEQLDQLLAPVALYPDTLLAQITTASTNPQEILDCNAWLQQNPNLGPGVSDAAQAQGFDPAFVALVNFPQVLAMMAQNIDDFAAIGQAFAADQAAVMDSVQRLRAQAYAAGALTNTDQQQIVTEYDGTQQIILIQPANPQVVYVPQYDPTVVYAGPAPGTVFLSFGAGIAIGALLVSDRPWGWRGWGWNWRRRQVVVNHNTWVVNNNYYRPPRPSYRPRPPQYQNRPGFGGNWGRPGAPRPPGGNGPRPGGPQPVPGRPIIPMPRPHPTPGMPPRPQQPPQFTPRPQPPQIQPGAQPGAQPRPQPRPMPQPAPRPAPQPMPRPAPQQPSGGGGNRPAPQAQPQPQAQRPGGFNVEAGGHDARAASARGAQSLNNNNGRRH